MRESTNLYPYLLKWRKLKAHSTRQCSTEGHGPLQKVHGTEWQHILQLRHEAAVPSFAINGQIQQPP